MALQSLIGGPGIDRVGVWLEDPSSGENGKALFRGEVWDQDVGDGPEEWTRLSADAPLPVELLGGGSFECALDEPQAGPILGPLIDLHRVLWTPVARRKVMRGLVMLGTRRKNGALPRHLAENLAAELGTLLELEEAWRLASSRKADLELWTRVRGLLKEKENTNRILGQLVENCTRGLANGGVGAVFAAIGESRTVSPGGFESSAAQLSIRAQSGDENWVKRVNTESLRPLWQRALMEGQSLGGETAGAFEKESSRIIVVPLRWGSTLSGGLLAGFSKLKANLDSLERLELRGELAAEILEQEFQKNRELAQLRSKIALLEAIGDAIVLTDKRGCVVGASGGARELLGKLPAFSGTDCELRFAELFRPRDWETMENWALGKSARPSEGVEDVVQAELSPGIGVRATRLAASGEEVVAIRLERRRNVAAGATERRDGTGRPDVKSVLPPERSCELRMLQAEELATLVQRVTGIAHELNNPLTAIVGHAQRILARGAGNPAAREIHQILEQAGRASQIVRQVLSSSREGKPERHLLSLNELVERTVDLQRANLNGFALHLRTDLAERLPRVDGDYGQLQQVLINLLQNAQQAIELSGVGDTFGVRTSTNDKSRVRMEVWDNGPGVPVEYRSRIFDPHFTTKPSGIGTGLGLAIVSAIVGEHGGSAQLDCPPEGGSRFIVELPAAEEELPGTTFDDKRVVAFRATGVGTAAPQGTTPRILVVEDEPTVANLIADVLRDEGMQVDVFKDGQTGLIATQRNTYDLSICDLKMPGMDGQTFYKELRRSAHPPRAGFLLITGDVVGGGTQEFLRANSLPYLAKPFRVEELTAAVRQVLYGNHHAAAP